MLSLMEVVGSMEKQTIEDDGSNIGESSSIVVQRNTNTRPKDDDCLDSK